MKFAPLGKSGLSLSRICLGTWQAFGWATSDDKKILKTIKTALDVGVNCIDTAPAYGKGHSEKLVGKAIKGKRDSVILATKVSHDQCAPEKLRASLEESLKNLQTDYIDLYQQHWPPKAPPLEETIQELLSLKKEGKIRAIGVSNWGEREFQEVSDLAPIDSLQRCYSLLWRKEEQGVFSLCKKENIGILAYSPLCQGILTGKIRDRENLPKDWRRQNVLTKEGIFPEVLTFIDLLCSISSRTGKSLSHIALQWILHRSEITSAIVGCSRPEQIEEAALACEEQLSDEDFELLTKKSEQFIHYTSKQQSLWGWHSRGTTT